MDENQFLRIGWREFFWLVACARSGCLLPPLDAAVEEKVYEVAMLPLSPKAKEIIRDWAISMRRPHYLLARSRSRRSRTGHPFRKIETRRWR